MSHESEDNPFGETEHREIYGDTGIISHDAKIPKFLILTYLVLPVWGLASLIYFWNGSTGWFDRGYWHELQIAANTTFPIENQNILPQNLEGQNPKSNKEDFHPQLQ